MGTKLEQVKAGQSLWTLNVKVFHSRADGYEVTKAMRWNPDMAWWWKFAGDNLALTRTPHLIQRGPP